MSLPGNEDFVNQCKARFLREAQTIAELSNPHVVEIFDVFEENSTAYYVMEFFEGGTLKSLVREGGALPEEQALAVIRQVGEALTHIHAHNILHLDVKPDNVMMRKNGDVVLIDFGISKHYKLSGEQTSTGIGPAYTPGYAPSEQYLIGGVRDFIPATDVYALAATLYFMLVGSPPPDAGEVRFRGLPVLPDSVSQQTVDAITMAMAYDANNRPQRVEDFLSMLEGDGRPVPGKNSREQMEQFLQCGSYREAWDLCLTNITAGHDVEYSRRVMSEVGPILRGKESSEKSKAVLIGIAIVFVSVFFFVAVRLLLNLF